jgi:hypothetical protein
MNELAVRADELWQWLLGLEPSFAFLLGIPLMVMAAGLCRYWFDRRRSRRT